MDAGIGQGFHDHKGKGRAVAQRRRHVDHVLGLDVKLFAESPEHRLYRITAFCGTSGEAVQTHIPAPICEECSALPE